MTWTRDSTTGIYTHAGSSRSAWMADDDLPAQSDLRLGVHAPHHNVLGIIMASPDGRSGIECGIDGSNVVIQSVRFGQSPSVLATAAHGLTAGKPFTMSIRPSADSATGGTPGDIEVYFDGDFTTPAVAHTLSAADQAIFTGRRFGFVSDVDQAKVTSAQVCELLPDTVERADVLVAICGGDLFAALDEHELTLIARNVAAERGPVTLIEFEQKMYVVGRPQMRIFDPVTMSVSDWTASAGDFPGGNNDATSDATLGCAFAGRIYLNSISDEQNIYASALGDVTDWDTGDDVIGASFALNTGFGRVGQPVRGLFPSSRGRLVIACSRSMFELIIDAQGSPVDLDNISLHTGGSGKDAAALVHRAAMAMHTTRGLAIVGAEGGTLMPISATTLTDLIQIDQPLSTHLVTLVPDPPRHGLHIFLSPVGGSQGTHLWYDERVGQYQPAAGGFFPEQYPADVGPACACLWNGRVVLGGFDARLRVFDDTYKRDDLSTAIESRAALQVVYTGDRADVLIHAGTVQVGLDSDAVTVTLYGGRTPEEAYVGASRVTMLTRTTDRPRHSWALPVRAPAIVIEMANSALDEGWHSEGGEIDWSPVMPTSHLRTAAAAPIAPGDVPDLTEPDPDPDPTGGPDEGEFPWVLTHPGLLSEAGAPGGFVVMGQPNGGGGGGGGSWQPDLTPKWTTEVVSRDGGGGASPVQHQFTTSTAASNT